MFKTRQKFGDSFLTIVHLLVLENTVRKIVKFDQIEHFGLSKKAALVSNFCLIGKIRHNFLIPRMIELGCKTFMHIQTFDLHRVIIVSYRYSFLRLIFQRSKIHANCKVTNIANLSILYQINGHSIFMNP